MAKLFPLLTEDEIGDHKETRRRVEAQPQYFRVPVDPDTWFQRRLKETRDDTTGKFKGPCGTTR